MSGYEQILKTSLNKYKNPDMARRDVLSVFTSFNDLRPKLDQYRAVYHIPICIWLMDTHPYNPPMVYVKPTPTMQIKSGRNVDMNGKIDLPFLREWKYPNSDLLGMIQILTIVFGEEPPVYSRVQQQPQQPATRYPNATTYPPAGGSSFPMPGMGGSYPYPSNAPYASSSGYPPASGYSGQYTGYPQQPSSGYQGYPSSYPSSTGTSSYPGMGGYPPAYNTTEASRYPTTNTSADCSREKGLQQHTDLNDEAVDQQKSEIQELTALVKEMNERIKNLEKQQQQQQQKQQQ